MLTEEQVMDALTSVMDPELHQNIVDLGMVREVEIQDNNVKVVIALTIPTCPLQDQIAADAVQAVESLAELDSVSGEVKAEVVTTGMTDAEKQQFRQKLQRGQAQPQAQAPRFPAADLNRVKTVVAVMSGKGGVGKSTVAAMLAAGARREGLRVGVLDADITGPSIPKLFGVSGAPSVSPLGIMPPTTSGGVKLISINLMLKQEEDAVIWRGPLIASAIQQFWNDVFWGDLDVLVVDMPPGTADAALTVMQALPVTGIVLVTSPQELAEMVVRKAANMAELLEIPLIGVVENMSYAVCPKCGERFAIFGEGKAEAMAEKLGTRFLGKMGLDPEISRLGDQGEIEAYESQDFAPVVDAVGQVVAEAPDPHQH